MVESKAAEAAKVLVVDDEPPARLRIKAMVEELSGYQVVGEAGNG